MTSRSTDFESVASASSATSPGLCRVNLNKVVAFCQFIVYDVGKEPFNQSREAGRVINKDFGVPDGIGPGERF
jgi:hypothetical protein